jgi:hypothetical protein
MWIGSASVRQPLPERTGSSDIPAHSRRLQPYRSTQRCGVSGGAGRATTVFRGRTGLRDRALYGRGQSDM